MIISRKIKRVIFSGLLFFLVFNLTSCQTPNVEGLNFGFQYTFTPQAIMIGVKSEETQFELNNIQLDFYYGNNGSKTVFTLSDENYEFVGFGVYFCNAEGFQSIRGDTVIDDYHSIANHIFIKEILSDEAFNGDFGYTNKYSSGVQFAHHEFLTVPSEVILDTDDEFYFRIIAIQYSKIEDKYFFSDQNAIRIYYEILDDGQIKLELVSRI